MDCIVTKLPYRDTNYFSKIVLDYLDQPANLSSFFDQSPTLEGIKKAIEQKRKQPVNREVLVGELKKQYADLNSEAAVERNIEALLSAGTFTITTAHQPNIFTGPLYFLYKILHAIKLVEYLNHSLPGNKFVPVYYMGCEDADLDELGHLFLEGDKLSWNTKQKGAVGHMLVDKELLKLIDEMEAPLSGEPFGEEVVALLRDSYKEGDLIQNATFRIVHALFGRFGLVVLIPDNAALKRQMIEVFKDDLLNQQPSAIVGDTSARLNELYKVQANPREINLFYLKDNIRERIEIKSGRYEVLNTDISFTKEELLVELDRNPERFSPNVILRGLFQETILPNIIFIGGGGELAYWLQLKDLFDHYNVCYPVLCLRNSFLIIEKKWQEKIDKLDFNPADFFSGEQGLLNKLVTRDSKHEVKLNGSLIQVEELYDNFRKQAAEIDETLAPHVDALKTRTIQRLQELEKKMLRAEKRKFSDQQRQIQIIREKLFPKNSLQERIDNFSSYYAKWGKDFIDNLYRHSLTLDNEFVILSEK
ncbi:MAG: bacillithiol biosynthesis cysteine-adding enzyme BshC [Chitinophagaceae bacterium]